MNVLHPALKPVCACESVGKKNAMPTHYDKNGNVLRGIVNSQDIGMCQINEYWNGAEAKSLGIDIYTLEGNIQFANILYKNRGLAPWKYSKSCWS